MSYCLWDSKELADLRWHYGGIGGAYILHGSDEVWTATRTDNGATLFAKSADELRDKIRADYGANPVPRPPMRPGPEVVRLRPKLA